MTETGPEGGTPARQVGHVTSSAWSTGSGCPIALAVVARSVAVGAEVRVSWDGGDVPARVVALPFDVPG